MQDAGAVVRAYDPEGQDQAKKVIDNITCCSGPYEAMQGADVLVVVTEWDVFRALDFKRVKSLLRTPVLSIFATYTRETMQRRRGLSIMPSVGEAGKARLESSSLRLTNSAVIKVTQVC
ncbi:UDP binding domain-containing protein [Sphingomonas aerolata]|uniref:UDP binding domain-containing protein n=1 Tax=Sphingomonas aerolata TaxID=185951 RepID=UPI002FE04F7C